MIRTWPGQTKEEWIAEYYRDKALTKEEKDKEIDEYIKSTNDKWDKINAEKNAEKQRLAAENPFENCDHPYSLENDEVTILWIVVMAVGTIFRHNWLIWIIATIIWRRYITRHKIKK
jgi:hypothetical protein